MFQLQTPQDDGLPIPDVNPWSGDKHYFLQRYIDAFTTSMRDKWRLHYIDLFAGAGIERVKRKGLDWGSPLIAAQAPHRFAQLHLGEFAPAKFDALRERVARFPQPTEPQLLPGDANQIVTRVVVEIPQHRTLSLAFLDPYGLHLRYETVQRLSDRKVDLIIFFPDHVDAIRNWKAYYADNPESNLDLVLGTNEWRARKEATSPDRWIDMLREMYEAQLKRLGFKEFYYERICRDDNRPLYRLIFCSRSEAGGNIWKKTTLKKPNDQRHFEW
jgi:three-Cys-motif partner protein